MKGAKRVEYINTDLKTTDQHSIASSSMSLKSLLSKKTVTPLQLKDWCEKFRDDDGEDDELLITKTSANKLGTLLNALIRGNTQEHFDQMIHIADTIVTCAEVQDNIAFLHEQKVFEKLLKALARHPSSLVSS